MDPHSKQVTVMGLVCILVASFLGVWYGYGLGYDARPVPYPVPVDTVITYTSMGVFNESIYSQMWNQYFGDDTLFNESHQSNLTYFICSVHIHTDYEDVLIRAEIDLSSSWKGHPIFIRGVLDGYYIPYVIDSYSEPLYIDNGEGDLNLALFGHSTGEVGGIPSIVIHTYLWEGV